MQQPGLHNDSNQAARFARMGPDLTNSAQTNTAISAMTCSPFRGQSPLNRLGFFLIMVYRKRIRRTTILTRITATERLMADGRRQTTDTNNDRSFTPSLLQPPTPFTSRARIHGLGVDVIVVYVCTSLNREFPLSGMVNGMENGGDMER